MPTPIATPIPSQIQAQTQAQTQGPGHYHRVNRWLPFYHLEDRLYGVLVCSISLPLITLAGFLIFSPSSWGVDALAASVLTGTLIALGGSMWLVSRLMLPLRWAQSALRSQRQQFGTPKLPADLDGDVGALLVDLQVLMETCERQRRQLEALQNPASARIQTIPASNPAARQPRLRIVGGADL